MMNAEYRGVWRIPERDEQIFGTLRFSPEEGLVLDGLMSAPQWDDQSREVLVIWGTTGGGKLITLQRCSRLTTWTNRNVTNFRCSVETAYIGAHLTEPEKASFRQAHLRLTRMRDWANIDYVTELVPDSEPETGADIVFRFKLPVRNSADTMDAEVSIGHRVVWQGGDAEPLVLTPDIYFDVKPVEPVSFAEWLSKYVRPLQNFLTLATSRPNGITELHLYPDEKTISCARAIPDESRVQVLFNTKGESPPEKKLWRMEMLFTLTDVADEWPHMIDRWLSISGRLGPTSDVIFALDYNDAMYLEHRFLSVAQAAESFHRRCYGGKRMPTDEHRRRVTDIIEAVPEEHRIWLQSLLQNSNQLSLLERLQDLLDRTRLVIQPLLRDEASFSKNVRDVRNRMTHQTDKPFTEREHLDAMGLTYVLSIILKSCLLIEMGLSPQRCQQLFRRNRRYRAEAEHLSPGIAATWSS